MSGCPICHKSLVKDDPSYDKFRPFCCRRCADVDLHRWLGEVYIIPAHETDPTVDITQLDSSS